MSKKISKVLLILCLLIGLTSFATAQIRYGEITGTVVDEDGIPLPGVTVTLESEIIATRTAVTSERGIFRFLSLDPGVYKLTCELPGFNTEVREPIKVVVGVRSDFRITLTAATIKEEIIVTAESPVVDTKKTGIAHNVTDEWLDNIPSARDPWVILDQTAGVMVDRVNVGGSQSGQQSQFTARGDSGDNVMWNVDGLTITDQSALGATPMYWDFDAFEEIQITTGGADPSIQTGGIGLNFVTKRGGNKFKGQAYFYRTDKIPQLEFQATNVKGSDLESYWRDVQGYVGDIEDIYPGDRINRIKDYGFEAGGPIIKDRLWVWGAWGVQDIKMFTAAGTPDDTLLDNINFKLNAQITDNNRAEFLYIYADKLKWGRGAAVNRPMPTTWDQQGPSNVYKIEDEHIFSDNFFATLRAGMVDMWFELEPKGGRAVPVTLDYDTGMWGGSFLYYKTWRPEYHTNLSANYFAENVLGGDHEFKFGFEYRYTTVRTQFGWAGNMVKTYWSAMNNYGLWGAWYGLPNTTTGSCGVWIVRPEDFKQTYTRISGWVGDTFTAGRLTLNLGVRYDWRISGHADPGSDEFGPWNDAPASVLDPVLLPAVRQEGKKDVVKWADFSPRVGFTYDITGDGKTLIRGSFARYADQLSSWQAYLENNSAYGEIDYAWHDTNGDDEVQAGELIDVWWVSSTVDLANPGVNPSKIDPDISAPITWEGLIGFEREVLPDFSLGANFIYRYYENFTWFPINDLTSDDYVLVPAGVNNAGLEDRYDGNYYEADYYQLTTMRPAGNFWTNRPDYNQKFWGVEITATKRLSNKWLMNASFNYNDHRQYLPTKASYQDPTNVEMLDGEIMAYEMRGSGKTDIWTNCRWQAKLNGMYQLPWGFNVSGYLQVREGYVVPVRLRTSPRSGGIGRAYPLIKPFGSERLPTFWMFDLRVEKVLRIGDYGSVSIMADVFNVFNNNTVLGREPNINMSRGYQPLEIINPRVFRLGIRFRF
ncbi:MAG: carboxypeptidase regulatory-like domain-containing protein [Candidatus Aminicenantia bacterium]